MKEDNFQTQNVGNNISESHKVSRRQWVKMAAIAAGSFPLAASILGKTAFARSGHALDQPNLSRINSHANLEFDGMFSQKQVNELAAKKRVKWSELSMQVEQKSDRSSLIGTSMSDEFYAGQYIRKMDEAAIDILCINTRDRAVESISDDRYWTMLERAARMRDVYPEKFILFCGIDPRRGQRGVDMLERAVKELGYSGMGEMLPHLHRFSPDDKALCYPLYEKCAELGIPISVNTLSRPGSALGFVFNPIRFAKVTKDFPGLNICLSSAGSPYWVEPALRLATNSPGVYLDTAEWQVVDRDSIRHNLEVLRRAMDTPLRYKIMYGGDVNIRSRKSNLKRWADILVGEAHNYGYSFTDEELNLYFVENFKNFHRGVRM